MKEKSNEMKDQPDAGGEDYELRDRYDFSDSIPNKFAERYAEGTNVVLLEPDVAEVFRDSESVNKVLRSFLSVLHNKKTPA